MILLLDVGNSTITLGTVRRGTPSATRRAGTRPSMTPDELELLIDGLLELDGVRLGEIAAVAACSTVPALSASLDAVASRRGLTAYHAHAGTLPLAIRVERPGEVGPDRLVNALAGHHLHGGPLIVVDFGTATTLDCVAPDGAFLGGAIAPGIELGLEALGTRTARLPKVEIRVPDRVIGRDTMSAIQVGTVLGHREMIAGLVARMRRELGEMTARPPEQIVVVATGGLSHGSWLTGTPGIDRIDPDLTLRGLALFHALVAGGERAEVAG